MNIHINEEDYKKLLKTVIVKITVGSQLYGLSNETSDTDVMYICGNFEDNHHSLVKLHHQYQYKENNIDHLFVDIQTYMNNLLKGDSTINFEAIYSDSLRNSELSFLYDNRFWFYNYQLIKSYLGFAKRDLKLYKKDRNNYKKLFHAQRGYMTAETLYFKREYSNDLKNDKLLYNLKNNLESVNDDFVNELDKNITDLRSCLNNKLEKKEIERIINNTNLEYLDNKVIELSKKYTLNGKFTNKEYYSAYQDDVKYD